MTTEYKIGIREEMDRRLPLPRGLMDWFTGKPLLRPGEKVEPKEPLALFGTDLALLGGSTAVSALALTGLPLELALLFALPASLVQVGILRKMQTLYGHEGSHENFFPRGHWLRDRDITVFGLSLNDAIAEFATAVALVQNEEDYGDAHDRHHAPETFTTLSDDDARDVFEAGFEPGLPVATYWRRFWTSLISPRFHWRQIRARFRSNWTTARRPRRIMSLAMLALLGGLAFTMPTVVWIGAILLPWTVFYHNAALAQVLNRHAWMQSHDGAATLQDYADRSWGRFSGVPLPDEGLSGRAWLGAWVAWWAEMLLLELPVRLASWSYDLQAHDYHHLEFLGNEEFVDDWTTMPARRQSAIDRGQDPFGMARRELWGWRSAMRHSLAKLSMAPPVAK